MPAAVAERVVPRTARADVRCGELPHQLRGDEEPGDDEEDVDADVAARDRAGQKW